MDTKSFVKILRKVIREEVGNAIKQALNETPVTDKEVINSGMNLHELVDSPTKPAKRRFVKNSMLNDILNDTAISSDFRGMYDQGEAPNFSDMGSMRPSNVVESMTGINGEAVDTSKPEIKAVGKALTRDYSSLMKAMDKRKGIK